MRRAICDIFGLKEKELLCGEEGAVVSAAGIAACACRGKLSFDWEHPVRREMADEEQKRKALPRYAYEKGGTSPDQTDARRGKALARD